MPISKAIAMLKIKKGITFIILLITSISFSQNDSIRFKNYNESQEWIEKVRLLPDNYKKNEILNKIETNYNLLPIVIENHIYFYDNFSTATKTLIHKIDEKYFDLIRNLSYTHNDKNEKCYGIVIVQLLSKPIINETEKITILKIKKNKKKIIIKLNSLIKTEVKISKELLLKNSNTEEKNIQIRKGKNRLKIKTDNRTRIISITNHKEKIIFIK